MKIMHVYVNKISSEEDKRQKVHILQTISDYKLNLAMAHKNNGSKRVRGMGKAKESICMLWKLNKR